MPRGLTVPDSPSEPLLFTRRAETASRALGAGFAAKLYYLNNNDVVKGR